MVVKN